MNEKRDEVLAMWVIYDHPKDFPNCFVARRWEVSRAKTEATDRYTTAETIEELREIFQRQGLYRIPRAAVDDEKIVETWL
jgi:hypothetical protein